MARSEARLLVDIWSDPDFRALTAGAQWTFMFLLSQRDLAHDGVIALRETRWSRASEGLTAEKLAHDLDELHEARFIVLDREEQELLVRSFLRRDKVYRQPNVLRAAADHLPLVSSDAIRRALAVELSRIAELDDLSEAAAPVVAEMRAQLPSPDVSPAPNPSGNPSEKGMQLRPGVRGMVTTVTTGFPRTPDLDSTSPETPSVASLPTASARTRARRGERIPDDFEPTPEMISWAREKAPSANRADHDAFVDYWRGVPGAKGRKLDWPGTWRNWMRKEHERRSSNGSRASPHRESTTDRRMADAAALIAELEAAQPREIQ